MTNALTTALTTTITTPAMAPTAPAEPVERLGSVEVSRREISKILRLTGVPALRQLAWHLQHHPATSLRDLCSRRGVHVAVVTQAFIDYQRNAALKIAMKQPPRRGGRRPPLRIPLGGSAYASIRLGNLPSPLDPLTRAARQRIHKSNQPKGLS